MNGVRKSLVFIAAFALAAFALPGIAGPQKTFGLSTNLDLSHAYTTDANGLRVLTVPLPISVTLTNLAPPSTANSNISSFTLTVKGMVITDLNQNTCLAQGASSCILDMNTNTVSVAGISPPIQAKDQFTLDMKVNSCGDGTWSATVWTGSSPGNGQPFGGSTLATNVSCGDAGCGLPFTVPNTFTVAGSPTSITGFRGQYNKDGSTCSATDYFATNTIPTDNILRFEYPSQPTATFRYTVNFSAPVMPYLSWFSNSAGAVFVAAQPCLVTQFDKNLPARYGTLAQDVNSSKNKIQVNVTATPTNVPFPIIVENERMQVINVSNNNWTVQRGQGGTKAVSHSATPTVYIMSTPRPLLTGPFDATQTNAGYNVGDQAHGCVASPDQSQWPSSTYDIIDIDDIVTWGR